MEGEFCRQIFNPNLDFFTLDCGSLQHFISKDHRELVQVNILSIEVGRSLGVGTWRSVHIRSQIQKYWVEIVDSEVGDSGVSMHHAVYNYIITPII